MRPHLLLVLQVFACAEPARSVDPVRATQPSGSSCPRSFRGVANGTPCSQALHCPFADGTCSCGTANYCGGAAPHPDLEAEMQKLRWTCTPKPPAVRADGCPGVEPIGDAPPCATDGQACAYGDCCRTAYQCTNGRWIRGETSCPP